MQWRSACKSATYHVSNCAFGQTLDWLLTKERVQCTSVIARLEAKLDGRAADPELHRLISGAQQVLGRYRTRLQGLEAMVHSTARSRETGHSDVLEIAGLSIGLQGHRVGSRLPDITPCRPISDWQRYVMDPPFNVGAPHICGSMAAGFDYLFPTEARVE